MIPFLIFTNVFHIRFEDKNNIRIQWNNNKYCLETKVCYQQKNNK